ncbi:30834_t:CDS:2, partial [Gigaspora margarita]
KAQECSQKLEKLCDCEWENLQEQISSHKILKDLAKIHCKETQDITKIFKDTICNYYNKIFHNIVINSLTEEDKILGSNKIIVEIDKSKFEDLWVVGITEKIKIRNIILRLLEIIIMRLFISLLENI